MWRGPRQYLSITERKRKHKKISSVSYRWSVNVSICVGWLSAGVFHWLCFFFLLSLRWHRASHSEYSMVNLTIARLVWSHSNWFDSNTRVTARTQRINDWIVQCGSVSLWDTSNQWSHRMVVKLKSDSYDAIVMDWVQGYFFVLTFILFYQRFPDRTNNDYFSVVKAQGLLLLNNIGNDKCLPKMLRDTID